MWPLRLLLPAKAPRDINVEAGIEIDVSSPPEASEPFDACLPLVGEIARANLLLVVPVQIAPFPVAPYSSTPAVLTLATG